MLRKVFPILFVTFLCAPSFADEHKDHPLLSRFPSSEIEVYDHADFGSQIFFYQDSNGKVSGQKKEGLVTRIYYSLKKETTASAIIRNIEYSLKAAGFLMRLKLSDDELSSFKDDFEKTMVGSSPMIVGINPEYFYMSRQTATGIQHIAVCVSSSGAPNFLIYYLILEEQQQSFIPLEASSASISAGLKENGKVELYGIYFDTAKTVVKPESLPTLEKIVKVLLDNPSLTLRIVGHTDNAGDFVLNQQLSEARAQAVLNALVQNFKIEKVRLSAHGVGSLAPLSTNSNEFGRAKNRRVELVQ